MRQWKWIIVCAFAGAMLAGCSVFLPPKPTPSKLPKNESVESAVASSEPETPRYPEFQALSENDKSSHAIVIMYHDIVQERTRDTMAYDITVEQFREDMQFMKDNGATFISVQELLNHFHNDTPLPPRAVVLTFDDNYQGVADLAVPILREFEAPWAMFVHTDFVGNTTQGRPKMTWETLKQLIADSKLTVGGHTTSHPEDISLLDDEKKRHEMAGSMEAIEKALGAKTPYMAWANGKYDAASMTYAIDAGYRISFTMDNGVTGTSPDIMLINRYPWQKTRLAWEERERVLSTLDLYRSIVVATQTAPVEKVEARHRRSDFVAIRGGVPASVLVDGRSSVGDLVQQFGGVGGINGGFFVMAAIAATDNKMIGPTIVSNRSEFLPSAAGSQESKLTNRPFVLWSEKEVRVLPYQFVEHSEEEQVKALLPVVTNAFLAGCWLVIDGYALSEEQILRHGPSDAMDWRKRAFIGWTQDGVLICGASTGSVSAERLAKGAVELGCKVAVMLDSGFSTSLVLNGEILASGHSNKDHPSRPVPHAIIVRDPAASPSQPETDSPEPEGKSSPRSGN